jgi:lysophospholipase L1-like esterase
VKRFFLILAIVGATAARAQQSQPMPVEWGKAAAIVPSKSIQLSFDVRDEVLQVAATPAKGAKADAPAVGLVQLPVTAVAADSDGIAFEYKGDGSRHYASVFLGDSAALLNGYEAFFPLDSIEWRVMTLRWRDFIKNDLPWDAKARLGMDDIALASGKLKFIGFGRGNANYKFFATQFGFSIRNFRVVSSLPVDPVRAYSKGLTSTHALIEQKKPMNILLLGDSITDFGGGKSYGYHCAQLIQKKWGVTCKVANAGIAGQTVRFSTIALPRSLRAMPQPDLVCIMYGANDCKAANPPFEKSGFSEAVFAKNLEALIDDVRRRTDGKADIILLSGVPRLDKRGGKTTGAVEKIVGAIKKVATQKETAYCDTFSAYLTLPTEQKNTYYMDTIHQAQPGLQYIGNLLFKTIETP